MELRPYQNECIEAIWDSLCVGDCAPVAVLPTGAGKSLVIAGLLDRAIRGCGVRALILTHRQELLVQNRGKLAQFMKRPESDFGLFCASLGSKTFKDVTFASVQSFAGVETLRHQNLLIIDEAHLVGPKESTLYRKLIARLRALNPKLKIVGLTATPFRMGQGLITEGANAMFTKIVYNANIKDLIDQGYLCHLTSKRTISPEINTEGARIVSGDFSKKDLEPRVGVILESAIPQILASGVNRKSWAIFTPSVAIAESVCGILRGKGVNASLLTGETDTPIRNRMIDSFKEGKIRCIVSVDVMTTGFDAPNIDMIVLLRPTKSLGLYIQMVGRGTRLAPAKRDCLVEGSLVLTDLGLVPIEKITKQMRVWDGLEWVSHDGAIFKGEREVIEYAGLTATEDHKVWTKEGWKTFGECASKQIAIAVTGVGRVPLRESQGCFRRDNETGKEECAVSDDCMHYMPSYGAKGISLFDKGKNGRLSTLWQPTFRTQVACHALHCSATKMRKPQRRRIRSVWSTRNRIQVRRTHCNGCLDSKESRDTSKSPNRPDQQQRPLRTREYSPVNPTTEPCTHTKDTGKPNCAQVQAGSSRDTLCGQHTLDNVQHGHDGTTSHREVLQKVVQTKRRVWDILNAGPLHRFTAGGLLVSNCLVLDFGGNIERFGPIDVIEIESKSSDKKKRKAPHKFCPVCGMSVALSVRTCTEVECQYEWPEQSKGIRSLEKYASDANILSEPELWHVNTDILLRLVKGGLPAVEIVYSDKNSKRKTSRFLCFDHSGFANRKAVWWWTDNVGVPTPENSESARTLIESNWVPPESIVITKKGKYFEVLKEIYGD
jgi:DNA repair protein RadD